MACVRSRSQTPSTIWDMQANIFFAGISKSNIHDQRANDDKEVTMNDELAPRPYLKAKWKTM